VPRPSSERDYSVRLSQGTVTNRSGLKSLSKLRLVNESFDVERFFDSAGISKRIVNYRKSQKVYSQGEAAKHVLYIQSGGIKLSVVNEIGKEAVVAILSPGDFFGERCLAGQHLRTGSATAFMPTRLLHIDKQEMIRLMRMEPGFSGCFVAHLLARNIRIEDDLVDQLFNSSEKRLARTLLLLADSKKRAQAPISNISQETLAEMIGTTRSRVNVFMNKFRKLGFIQYKGGLGLHVDPSLLSVVLRN
jgi:CRP/FNR family transcriptional regulator, cyclic AMP receptor protein